MYMASTELKLKCIKCGYGIPLTSQEYRKAQPVKCPKCSNLCSFLQDEEDSEALEETIIEE